MKLSGKVILGCLILSFALLFGGCGIIPNPFAQEPSGDTAAKKAELEKQEKDKQGQINQLKTDLEGQQKKAVDERSECDKMTEETKNLPGNKNPESVKDAPNTVAQCAKAVTAERLATDTMKKLDKAENELGSIKTQISQLSGETTSSSFDWLLPLLIGVAALLGLTALLGGLYFFLSKKFDKAMAEERGRNQESFTRIRGKHETFDKRFTDYGNAMNDFEKKFSDFEKLVKLQQGKIELLEFKLKEVGGGSGGQFQSQSAYEQPKIIKPEPQFPVLLENYLNKVGSQAQRASADLADGLLVQDPNKNEEFVIVKDGGLDAGIFYVVPSIARFQTKSEYFTYYQNFYNCENPSGGAVWIKTPTLVRKVAEGWQLERKGELEVR
jgi:hypothetical protein